MAILKAIRGPDAGKAFPVFRCREGMVIGRGEAAGVPLNDARASRRHSRIAFAGGEWTIEDLRSSNGTLVGGERVERAVIATGAAIQVGATLLEFDAEKLADFPPELELGETSVRRAVREAAGVFVFEGYQAALDRDVRVDWLHPARVLGEAARAAIRAAFRQAFDVKDLGIVPLIQAECPEDGEAETLAVFKGAVVPSLRGRWEDVLRLPLAERLQLARQIAEVLFRRSSAPLLRSPVGIVHVGLDWDVGAAPAAVVPPVELSALVAEAAGDLPHLPEHAPYLPPEHQGALPAGLPPLASAQYNAGAIAYHLLTGHKPCGEGSVAEILENHRTLRPAPANLVDPGVPEEVSEVLERMLEKAPEKRPAEAAEVLERFSRGAARLFAAEPSPPRAPAPPPARPPAARAPSEAPARPRVAVQPPRPSPPREKRAPLPAVLSLPLLALAAAALFFAGRFLSHAILRALEGP